MGWKNELFEAHRRHPRQGCKTIQVFSPEHVAHLRMCNDAIAHKIGLIHLGDNLFKVQNGRDIESVMQSVEAALSAYDQAVADAS